MDRAAPTASQNSTTTCRVLKPSKCVVLMFKNMYQHQRTIAGRSLQAHPAAATPGAQLQNSECHAACSMHARIPRCIRPGTGHKRRVSHPTNSRFMLTRWPAAAPTTPPTKNKKETRCKVPASSAASGVSALIRRSPHTSATACVSPAVPHPLHASQKLNSGPYSLRHSAQSLPRALTTTCSRFSRPRRRQPGAGSGSRASCGQTCHTSSKPARAAGRCCAAVPSPCTPRGQPCCAPSRTSPDLGLCNHQLGSMMLSGPPLFLVARVMLLRALFSMWAR
jgi:hypothetical protein